MATLSELQTELAAINTAIAAVLDGNVSEYSTSNVRVKRLDLKTLYAERRRIENQIAFLTRGRLSAPDLKGGFR